MKRLVALLSTVALSLLTFLLVGCSTERLAPPFSSMLPECKEIEGIGHNQEDSNYGPYTPEPGAAASRPSELGGGFRSCKGKGLTLHMSVALYPNETEAEKWMAGEHLDCVEAGDTFLHCREVPSDHLLAGVDEVAEYSIVDYPIKLEEEDRGQDGAATVFIPWRKGVVGGFVEFIDERPVVAREEGEIVDVFELDYADIGLAEEIFGRIRDAIRSY
jgi:hypothetical protein